jgi:hypothetical protein
MHGTDDYLLVLQIQAKQLTHHVQGGLAGMMSIIPSSFLVSERDGSGFGGDEQDFGTSLKMTCTFQGPNDERW